MVWQRSIAAKAFPDIFSIGLSAGLLILIFPNFDWHFLAWIALVPLFLLIKRTRPAMAFWASLVTGCLFFGVLLWWTITLDGANPVNWILLVLGNAFYFGLFGVCAHYFQKNAPRWNFLTFPAVWVVFEYLHIHLASFSFPWGILGYSQYSVLPVARISSYVGVHGVSFLIVLVNIAVVELIFPFFSASCTRISPAGCKQSSWRTAVGIFVGVIFLFSASYLSGRSELNEERKAVNIKAALIQGNIYWEEGKDSRYRETIYETYRRLSLEAAKFEPDLILWPSSSVTGIIPRDLIMTGLLSDMARESSSFLLAGAGSYDKFNKKMRKEQRVSNSVFLFSPQGKIIGRYDKIRLVPFDEYLPLRDYIKWPSWITDSKITDYMPGEELTIFKTDQARFGVQICWENLFPDQFRKMTAQWVDFMVSMTNETFVDIPSAHYQMLAMNVFRAIENRIAILRITPTGVSAIIQPSGRITAMVKDNNSNALNIQGYVVGQIPLSLQTTLYTRYGDWFVYCLFAVIGGLVIVPVFRKTHTLKVVNP